MCIPIGVAVASAQANALTFPVTPIVTYTAVGGLALTQAYGAEVLNGDTQTATVSGETTFHTHDYPQGTVTFTASEGGTSITLCSASFPSDTTVGPGNSELTYTCNSTPSSTTALPSGTYTLTASFVPAGSGSPYNGDSYTSSTGNYATSLVIDQTTTALATNLAAGPYPAGSSVGDGATLTGGVGTNGEDVTFYYFYGNDTCAGGSIDSNGSTTAALSGDVANGSIPAPSTTGTLFSVLAEYGGDNNNPAANAACEGSVTTITTPATPTITTVASPDGNHTVPEGNAINDVATISGLSGTNATGLVTITAQYGGCGGPVAFSQSVSLNSHLISGTTARVTTTGFTPSETGTYYWSVVYAGDTNNSTDTEACGGTHESSKVVSELFIDTDSLPNGTAHVPYVAYVDTSGGTGAVHFRIVDGALPIGFHLNGTTGKISGTTAVAGYYSFEVEATDSGTPSPQHSYEDYSITIFGVPVI